MVFTVSMSTNETYEVVPMNAAERAGNRPDECGCCDRAGLKHIVKLRNRGGIVWMGTGCASVALYGRRERAAAVVKAFDAVNFKAQQEDDMKAERRVRFARALELFNIERDGGETKATIDEFFGLGVRRTFAACGGFEVLGSFPAWLGRVAETGDLD